MATVQGTLARPETEASVAIQQVATEQGWELSPGESGGGWIVFNKGMTAISWGAQLRVHFQPTSPSETRLTISTGETFALTDWGRGKRAAKRLLEGVGARIDAS
jgi:hypothetical protein